MSLRHVCFWIVGLAMLSALLPACNRTATRATVTDDYDQFGDRNQSVHAEARVLTRKGEAQYESAKQLLAQGKFNSGIADLERLIADRSIDPEIREQAMLSAAEAHGSWLNPSATSTRASTGVSSCWRNTPSPPTANTSRSSSSSSAPMPSKGDAVTRL